MDDPWAAWGKSATSAAQRMMSLSPPPESLDVSDPWAPTPARKAAQSSSTAPDTASDSTAGPSMPAMPDMGMLRDLGMQHAQTALQAGREINQHAQAAAASAAATRAHATAAVDAVKANARALEGLPTSLMGAATGAAGSAAAGALEGLPNHLMGAAASAAMSGQLDGLPASLMGAAAMANATKSFDMGDISTSLMSVGAAATKQLDAAKFADMPATLMGKASSSVASMNMGGMGAALGGWGDAAAGWGTSSASPSKPTRSPSPVRSLSPELTGDVWGAPTPSKSTDPAPQQTAPEPSPTSPTSFTASALPRASIDDMTASAARLSMSFSQSSASLARSISGTLSSPRKSVDKVARLAEEEEAEEGFASPRASLDAIERISREVSRAGSPLAVAAASAVARADSIPPVSVNAASPTISAASASSPRASLDALRLDADAPPLRRTPSFGSDFGGFADAGASDPWGGGGDEWGKPAGAGGDQDESFQSFGARSSSPTRASEDGWGTPAPDEPRGGDGDRDADEGAYEGWGGVSRSAAAPEPSRTTQETEWEEAQRRIAVQESRAPYAKIEALKREWDEVAASVITHKVENADEAEETKLEAGVKALQDNVAETMRSLTTPGDGRVPPLHTLTTHQRYTGALSRANPNPSTSLLHLPPSSRARRLEGLNFGPGLEDNWTGRSRLGEPEELAAAQPAQEDAGPSRWGFWRKSAAPKSLVTSGGGILEVKTPTLSPSTPTSVATAAGTAAAAAVAETASIAPSVASARLSTSRAPSLASRPATPDVSVAAAPPALAVTESHEDEGHDAPSRSLSEDPQAQPARMSRFFRWGRKAAAPAQEADSLAPQDPDIELSADDFAFLAEVPTVQQAGMGDLLGMDPNATREMNTLERVLNAPKPAPLPAPLAPPPRGAPQSHHASRQGSTSSSSFRARMAPSAAPKQSAMDLLSGLDFDAPASATSSSGPNSASPVASSISGWDDLFATPAPPRASTPPTIAPPINPSSPSSSARNSFQLTSSPLSHSTTLAASTAPPATSSSGFPPPIQRIASPPATSPLATAPPLSMSSMVPSAPTQRVSSPPLMTPMAPMAPMAPTQRVASPPVPSSFTPMVPTARPASVSPTATGTANAADAAFSTGTSSAFSGLDFSSFSSVSAAPSRAMSPPSVFHVAPPPAAPALAPQTWGGITPSTAPLSPNPASRSATPSAFPGISPIPAPVAPVSVATAAAAVAAVNLNANDNDDFGDFGDFGDFSAPSAAASTVVPAAANNAGSDSFDDFGDFGDFDTSFASIPPPPVSKTSTPMGSPGPTPPAKGPEILPSMYAIRPPAGISSRLAAAAPGGPSAIPTLPPPDSSFGSSSSSSAATRGPRLTDSSTTMPALSTFSTRGIAPVSGSSRRQPSVDHTPALSLVTAASQTSGKRWPAPPSPNPPAIAPPSGFLPPPPGGRRKPQVNLLEDFDF